MADDETALGERFLAYIRPFKGGVNDDSVRKHFGAEYSKLPRVLSRLMQENWIKVSRNKDDSLEWAALDKDERNLKVKLSGLSDEEKYLFRLVKDSHTDGIWRKDLKSKSGILNVGKFEKYLKKLVGAELIKMFKTVEGKFKKFYILYDLNPKKELTGGAFHTNNEFDSQLITALQTFVLQCIEAKNKVMQPCTLEEITNTVRKSALTTVQLTQR